MLFPTIDFAIFFAVVFLGNWLLKPYVRSWKWFILAASYVFYGWWDWRFVFLLAFSTLLTVGGGEAVHRARDERGRRIALMVTVASELALLGWFKYAGFLSLALDNIAQALGRHSALLTPLQVTLPIGISFFTFMGLSYVIDLYRRELVPSRPLDVAVFVAFFPHLVAGPIVRGADLLPQIGHAVDREVQRVDRTQAAILIFGGLCKKVVISSYVSSAIVDPVFANPRLHTGPEILLAVYGYAVQIYCDFSGYTDIAIGCAMLLGFHFPQNFDRPYRARSLQDFWRRWHITLSMWLRDYLYVPLGGNRGSRLTTYRNIMITMVLGGLWHGAAWTFVMWGALHGSGQCLGHAKRSWRLSHGRPAQSDAPGAVIFQRVMTFQVVCLAWLFFRADTIQSAFTLCHRLLLGWGEPAPLVRAPVILAIVGALALQYLPRDLGLRLRDAFGALPALGQAVALGLFLLVITTLGPAGVAPFIYFRF